MTEMDRPTVYIETYGCQMNVSDSELMLGKLTQSGYEAVDVPEDADVILVNTCVLSSVPTDIDRFHSWSRTRGAASRRRRLISISRSITRISSRVVSTR